MIDRSGQIGYWAQSYAPGLGISSQRTGTGPGAITTPQTTAGRRRVPADPGSTQRINGAGAAIGSGQSTNGGALPDSPPSVRPFSTATSALLFEADGPSGSVAVVDLATKAVVKWIKVGDGPWGVIALAH